MTQYFPPDCPLKDSKELFLKDTLKGGAKRPEVAKVLCYNSGADVEWLMDSFDLDLSLAGLTKTSVVDV